jgi:hypothetical protein
MAASKCFARKMEQDFGLSMAHGHAMYNLQLTGAQTPPSSEIRLANFDVVAKKPITPTHKGLHLQ